jgi:hypothetical protein
VAPSGARPIHSFSNLFFTETMKSFLIFRLSLVLFVFASTVARAQMTAAPAAPAGYWNTETNLTTHDHTTVRFYNAQDQLVYEEILPTCLNLTRRAPRKRTTARLNLALARVLADPAAAQGTALLAQQFGQGTRVPNAIAVR